MLAGGEEYFQPPEPIDHDSLCRFAAWCKKLRGLEKPGKKSLETLAREGDAVGAAMHVKEVVAGTVLRAIKQSAGVKRHACWCLLDLMSKTYKSTFAFLFELHLADVAADCIDWDDPNLAPKYEQLLEHWDTVFDKQLIQTLWSVRRKERLWAASHPEEARRQRDDEEATWDREIERSKDEEGLDNYGEPCLPYLQGRCSWGDKCTQLHPPGLEGSLPPESRAGDWRCPSCSMINRHFRRRCFSCVAEKPQYKKGADFAKTPEVVATCKAETRFLDPLASQFGYDFNSPDSAVKFWSEKLSSPAQVAEYIQTRRQKYQSQILPKILETTSAAGAAAAIRTPMVGFQQQQQQQSQSSASFISASSQQQHDDTRRRDRGVPDYHQQQQQQQTKKVEISVSAVALTGSPFERVSNLSSVILEDGVHHADFLKNLFMLSKTVGDLANENRKLAVASTTAAATAAAVDENTSLIFFELCRMVHTAWLAAGKKRPHPAVLFLGGLLNDLTALTFLTPEHRSSIKSLAESV